MNTLSLHEAALSYAERGYPVFPVKVSGKKPAGGHGFKDATVDVRLVDQWWEKNSRYNIGLSCEPMCVLDVDRKSDGDASFARICEEIGADAFDDVPLVNTPGGRHFWYRQPEPPIMRQIKRVPGIDLLGVGGYAVAPPSVRADGSYRWAPEFADDAEELRPGDLPEFPRVLRDYLIAATPARVGPRLVAVRSVTSEFGKIALGDRTSRLVSLAGTLVAGNFPAIADTLRAFNASACVPPLTEHELNSIIHSMRSFEPRFADGAFIVPWLSSDLGTDSLKVRHDAMRMLVLMSKSAAPNGTWAPPRSQVTQLLGLSKDDFYAARNALEACGAIIVQPRGTSHSKLSSVVVLQWKPGLRAARNAA